MAGVNELASRIQDTHVALTIVANDGFSEIDATLAAGTPGLAADAWLEVIVVSESDDETNLAPATLASRVNAEKPVDGVSAVSGIVVPNGSTGTCMRSTTTRYNGVITGTGGRSTSVCARNWNTVLGNLGGALFGTQFAYPLTGAPDAASIAVTVGGVTLGASDYTYDPTQNRVLLSAGALPEPNATVDVSYVPVCP